MNITIPVHSDQDLSPRAAEVIRAITDDAFPEHIIKFVQWNNLDLDAKVLVMGRAPEGKYQGITWVHTYSVAQIMSKANAASVFKAALRQFLEEPEPIPFKKPTKLPSEIVRLFRFDKPVAIDIETSGNLGKTHTPEEVGIISVAFYQPEMHEPRVVVGPWNAEQGKHDDLTEKQVADLFEQLPKFEKAIYHNGKFDIRVMNRVFGIELVNWFDTMLAHHVLNIAAGDHKLKTAARRYLGAPEWEADLSKYTKGGGHYELIPTDKLVAYNGWDVYWTYKLWEFLAPQIEADENNQKAFMLEMAEADFLLPVEQYGIPYDLDYADEFSVELTDQAQESLWELRRLSDVPMLNPNSPQQVKAALGIWGIEVDSTNEATLLAVQEELNESSDDYKFIERLLEYRGLMKVQSTYINGWASKVRNGRVHPTFLVHGTSTGRLSSTGPNAQNMPRDKKIRRLVKTNGEG